MDGGISDPDISKEDLENELTKNFGSTITEGKIGEMKLTKGKLHRKHIHNGSNPDYEYVKPD